MAGNYIGFLGIYDGGPRKTTKILGQGSKCLDQDSKVEIFRTVTVKIIQY